MPSGGQHRFYAGRSRRENIVSVLHSEIAETGQWAPDQVLYLQLAIDLLEQARLLPERDYLELR